jgi:serine/threonine protein kinase, bacterial
VHFRTGVCISTTIVHGGVQMLANIAKRLSHMHEAGFVHRDLKPGNVMWLPRENRWTVIDFGCVAKVGEPVTICYSLRYTAPEVIMVRPSPFSSRMAV